MLLSGNLRWKSNLARPAESSTTSTDEIFNNSPSPGKEWKRQIAAGLVSSLCLAFTWMHPSYKSTNIKHTHRQHLGLNKRKTLACAHTFLHPHFNTHKPCQYLMSRSLPGWFQLSFRDNVCDVSIPFPVLMHSPHWRRYNSLDDRTNDILASLFSLCPPLKDSIMCNPMPRHNTTSLDAYTAVSDNLEDRIAIHPGAHASLFFFFIPPTYRGWHGQDGVIDLSKASCQRGCIRDSDDPSPLLLLPLIKKQASYYL